MDIWLKSLPVLMVFSADNFQGNRSPYQDPLARGAIWGLLSHLELIFCGLYNSTAYGTFHILETLARDGFQAEEIYVSGGRARVSCGYKFMLMWLIFYLPDHCGRSQYLGTAPMPLWEWVYGSIPEATLKMVQISGQIYPCQQNREIYHFYYEQYVKSYW